MGGAIEASCPICAARCELLDVVDFNKSCEEARGKFVPLSGDPIYYVSCPGCQFCFAPQVCAWSPDEFAARIYNDEYSDFDPDYKEARPKGNANHLLSLFGARLRDITHLDYGGGSGLLSRLLCEQGVRSRSFDRFVDHDLDVRSLGRFDLITAYEVFEHVPDVQALMCDLVALRTPTGMILFSTLLSDGQIARNQRLSWWYASPRNGHISLFSRASLSRLSRQYGLTFGSFNTGFHALWTTPPDWGRHIIR
jgi:hypothetical protein